MGILQNMARKTESGLGIGVFKCVKEWGRAWEVFRGSTSLAEGPSSVPGTHICPATPVPGTPKSSSDLGGQLYSCAHIPPPPHAHNEK